MKSNCGCKICRDIREPVITSDGKFKIICPVCGGFRLIFDSHAGAVSCHDCRVFNTYDGSWNVDYCMVSIEKLLENK